MNGKSKMNIMAEDEQDDVNKKIKNELLNYQESLRRDIELRMKELSDKSKGTFQITTILIFLILILGFVIIVLSLYSIVTNPQDAFTGIGLGAIGVGSEVFALYMYKPMNRLNKLSADYNQEILILKNWVMAINLYLMAMDVNDRDSVGKAADKMREVTIETVNSIQKFLEGV